MPTLLDQTHHSVKACAKIESSERFARQGPRPAFMHGLKEVNA